MAKNKSARFIRLVILTQKNKGTLHIWDNFEDLTSVSLPILKDEKFPTLYPINQNSFFISKLNIKEDGLKKENLIIKFGKVIDIIKNNADTQVVMSSVRFQMDEELSQQNSLYKDKTDKNSDDRLKNDTIFEWLANGMKQRTKAICKDDKHITFMHENRLFQCVASKKFATFWEVLYHKDSVRYLHSLNKIDHNYVKDQDLTRTIMVWCPQNLSVYMFHKNFTPTDKNDTNVNNKSFIKKIQMFDITNTAEDYIYFHKCMEQSNIDSNDMSIDLFHLIKW